MYHELFLLSVLALCRSTVAVATCGGLAQNGYHVRLNPHGVKYDHIVGFGPADMIQYTTTASYAWSTVWRPTRDHISETNSKDVTDSRGKVGFATAIVRYEWDYRTTAVTTFFAENCYQWCQAYGYNYVAFLIFKDDPTGKSDGTFKGTIILAATRQICETC